MTAGDAATSTLLENGLTDAQVRERIERGEINEAPTANARSLGDIIRKNTFTWFNGLIGSLWVIMLLVAPIQDSLFGFVIVANTLIGIVQEYRAARTLEKLAVLGEAKPVVRRDGQDVEIRPSEVVLDDVIILRTGDQLVVDGVILEAQGLQIDESLLTGEADPVDKHIGEAAMSGSFVVAGAGAYRATRVGRESFAAGLTEQAKKFELTNSELRDAINRFIRIVSYFLVPVGVLLLTSQLIRADLPVNEAIRGTIAGVVTMVPEGLVLLTSIAMAVSVIRLAQRRVLVQDLPAVEVLARVDTVCADKTGTLTEPGMHLGNVVVLGGASESDVRTALGAIAAAEIVAESDDPGDRAGLPGSRLAGCGLGPVLERTQMGLGVLRRSGSVGNRCTGDGCSRCAGRARDGSTVRKRGCASAGGRYWLECVVGR
jgi:cation-transporting P-type ATPase E